MQVEGLTYEVCIIYNILYRYAWHRIEDLGGAFFSWEFVVIKK